MIHVVLQETAVVYQYYYIRGRMQRTLWLYFSDKISYLLVSSTAAC
jgi:hypothetical protein